MLNESGDYSPTVHAASLTDEELRDAYQCAPASAVGSPLHLALKAEWERRVRATCVHGYPATRERSPYAGLVDRSGHVMHEFESFVTVDDNAHADTYGTYVCDASTDARTDWDVEAARDANSGLAPRDSVSYGR